MPLHAASISPRKPAFSPSCWQPVVKIQRTHRGPAKVKPRPRSSRERREEGEYREYSTHRGQRPAPPMAGCIGGRMQRGFHHGLLEDPVWT